MQYVKKTNKIAAGCFVKYLKEGNCNNIFDLIVKGHTRSSLHYYTWATIDTFLRQFIGVVWIYKKWKYFEFYYGSVIGIGWCPRCLRFNKLRVGFFDLFVNIVSVATTLCNLFLTRLILREKKKFFDTEYRKIIQLKLNSKVHNGTENVKDDIYYSFLSYTPACNYIRKLDEVGGLIFALVMSTFNLSFINLQMFSGFIRVKFLTFHRIAMCFKHELCCIFANAFSKKGEHFYAYTHAVAGLPFFFKGNKSIFAGKFSIFLLILQLLIANIEINISALH